jgi:hypothetical protein
MGQTHKFKRAYAKNSNEWLKIKAAVVSELHISIAAHVLSASAGRKAPGHLSD